MNARREFIQGFIYYCFYLHGFFYALDMKKICNWGSDTAADMSPVQTYTNSTTNPAELAIPRIPENLFYTAVKPIWFLLIFAATVEIFLCFFEYRRNMKNRSITDKEEATDKHEATTHQKTPQRNRRYQIEILSETV